MKRFKTRKEKESSFLFFVSLCYVGSFCAFLYFLYQYSQPKFFPGAILIDVRRKDEFEKDHIDGAINIPLDRLEKQIHFGIPNKNTEINLYCLSGARAEHAKCVLKSIGYVNVLNLGGIERARKLLKIE